MAGVTLAKTYLPPPGNALGTSYKLSSPVYQNGSIKNQNALYINIKEEYTFL